MEEEMQNGDVTPPLAEEKVEKKKVDKAARRRAANARRRLRKKRHAADDSEDEKLKKRLLKKAKGAKSVSGSKSKEAQPTVREIKSGKHELTTRRFEVANPEAYRRLVCRFEENQINKAPKPATGEYIEGPWTCALCQKGATGASLGDLFGPYYAKIGVDTLWPPYIKHKLKKQQTDVYTDLWFHGYCALWASGILAKGNVLIGFDEHLPEYWKQKCSYCSISGASIGCASKGCKKIYHYVCALDADCILHEENLVMDCVAHKKT